MSKRAGSLNYGMVPRDNNNFTSNTKPLGAIERFVKDTDIIDMSDKTLDVFYDDLQKTATKRQPIFIWSKKRRNEKIKLDVEYQSFILEKISNLRRISDEYKRFKADQIFTEEFIRDLVADNRMAAKHHFEKAIAEHELTITQNVVAIKIANNLVDHDNIAKGKEQKIVEGIDAQNRITNAQAISIETNNDIKKIIRDKMAIGEITPSEATNLLSVLSGNSMNSLNDLEFLKKLNDLKLKIENLNADRQEAELKDFINSSEFRKWKYNQSKKDAGENGL